MNDLTLVQLTPADAALFVSFQKRHAFMKVLESVGAFDIKSGTLEVHFDAVGNIGSIDINRHIKI